MSQIGTLDELITELEDAREALGGDAPVRIARQPGWPLRGMVAAVTTADDPDAGGGPHGELPGGDSRICWIASTDEGAAYDEDPYAPRWAWGGDGE